MAIYFTSDLHIGHDKEFLYRTRGFETIAEHDQAILENWNQTVGEDDEVYLLGDVMLTDVEHGLEILKKLHGHIHIIRGNHDTNAKIKRYEECDNVVEVVAAAYLQIKKISLYLSHYPTLVSHGKMTSISHTLINLYGHTHQSTNFYEGLEGACPYMYHVGVDSHGLTPVLLEDIIEEIKAQKDEYYRIHKNENE